MGNEASIQAARADEVALVQAASGDLEVRPLPSADTTAAIARILLLSNTYSLLPLDLQSPLALQALHALLKQNPQLVYSHSRATGENLWHFAAQGGHAEV